MHPPTIYLSHRGKFYATHESYVRTHFGSLPIPPSLSKSCALMDLICQQDVPNPAYSDVFPDTAQRRLSPYRSSSSLKLDNSNFFFLLFQHISFETLSVQHHHYLVHIADAHNDYIDKSTVNVGTQKWILALSLQKGGPCRVRDFYTEWTITPFKWYCLPP